MKALVFAFLPAILGSLFLGTSTLAETFTNNKGVSIAGTIVTADLATDQVTVFVEKHRKEFVLKVTDLSAETQAVVQAWWDERHPKPAEWVKPGASKTLEFSDLPNCNHNDGTAACSVLIPSNFDPDKPVPLMVWIAGGKGGNGIAGATSIAGSEHFVCVSLPYPPFDGRDIFDRQKDDGLVPFWQYHKTMLDAVAKAIPNIDPRLRAVGGFSNGTHSIAGYFNQVESEIGEFFNVFVIGDGGVYEGDWQRSHFAGDHAYCCWGETSPNKKMTVITADAAEGAGMIVTRSEMAETGHKFTPEEKQKVKSWLLETVMPARLNPDEGL